MDYGLALDFLLEVQDIVFAFTNTLLHYAKRKDQPRHFKRRLPGFQRQILTFGERMQLEDTVEANTVG